MYTCINGRRVAVLSKLSGEVGGAQDYSNWPYTSTHITPNSKKSDAVPATKTHLTGEDMIGSDPFGSRFFALTRDNMTVAGIRTFSTLKAVQDILRTGRAR